MFGLEMQDLAAQLEVRIRQRLGHAPFEAVDEPIDNAVEFHGRPVAAENQLSVLLMEMVENWEEHFGSTGFAGKFLKVVEQDGVHALEPLDKIGNLAIHLSHSVQILELTHGYEEYFRARVALLDAYSDRLDEVSLPHPDITIEEERIEIEFLRVVCDMLSDSERQHVALAHAVVLEGEHRVQLRVKVLGTRLHRILLYLAGEGVGHYRRLTGALDLHGRLRVGGDSLEFVEQLPEARTECIDERESKDPLECILIDFLIIGSRDTQRDFRRCDADRLGTFEPCVELLLPDVILYDLQALVPFQLIFLLHLQTVSAYIPARRPAAEKRYKITTKKVKKKIKKLLGNWRKV